MFSRGAIFLLLLMILLCKYKCVAKDSVRIGVFFNEDQEEISYWDVIRDNMEEDIELLTNITDTQTTQRVSTDDIFEEKRKLCYFLEASKEERIVAILGPRSPTVSTILESVCSHLSIPYIITSWRPKTSDVSSNVLSLYPDADLLSRGMAKIVESFDWPAFVLLYEDDASLIRLQEVLKLREHNEDKMKNDILIRRLEPGGDNRYILKNVKSLKINRIIVDCQVDKIMDFFHQAQEINLLSDISRSFFLTSLDAHTLDFAPLKTEVNITTVRLYDPAAMNFQAVASQYFPDVSPNHMRVETAIVYDAVTLITEAINDLKSKKVEFSPREIQCDSEAEYEDELDLVNVMKQLELADTLTGPISLQNGIRDKFILEVIETDIPDKPIGIWNSENPDHIHLTRNATEREAELRRRIENHNFIVTSRIGPPYLYESNKIDAYKNDRYYGYSMDLIAKIAKLMNITFEFRITEGNSYSNLQTDLIEGRADLAICDFTITPQRREIIDFSLPFMNLGIGILHKGTVQEEDDNMYAFMRPISWRVWFYIWTFSLVSSITLFIVARMSPGEWENPKPWDPESKELENIWTVKNFLWLCLGSVTAQGCDILPKAVPARVISAAWWFFCLIIINSYIANLTAFLTMSKRDATIDSVEELAAQSKVKYGCVQNQSTEKFFSMSNVSLYQKMWSVMKNEKPSVFEADNDAGVERVLSSRSGLYAFLMESTGIEYQMERYCELRRIGGLLDSKSYGIGMPMNADYRHSINSALLHLQETGQLMELKTKWWKNEVEPCDRTVEEQSDSLTLAHVGGVFIVLAVGLGLAYGFAILEFLWHVRQLSVEEHLTFMETLKCEIKFACNIFSKRKRAKPVPSESSSSTSSEPEHDKLSIARSIFSKSVSLLNVNSEADNGLRCRQRSPSRASKATNHLRVN